MPSPSLTEHVEETVTRNGAIVLSEELPHVASVAVGIWIAAGSRHEADGEAGLTHFLEHMFFKGTRRRTARRIAEELDAVGGHLDASTSREQTGFYARVLGQHLPLACDVLCDQLLHSVFRPRDLSREKGVVLEEIRSYEDEPGELVMDQLMATFYGAHPLARPVLGRREVIRGTTRSTLSAYRHRHYAADRLVIAAAGRVKHREILRLLAPLLRGLPDRGVPRETRPPHPGAARRIVIRRQEQAHLALAAPALPFHHPDRYALNVLNNILGGGVSSRLFQEIREKRGLAYGASSGLEAFHDAGMLVIHTSVDPAKFREAARVIGEILDDLAQGRVLDAEVTRGREQLKGNVFLSLESTSSRMGRMAMSKMYLGRVTPLAEVMAQVDAVTTATVRRLARELLDPRRFAAAILGPGRPGLYRVPWLANAEVLTA